MPLHKTCRILIADDHEVFRRGLRCLLEGRPGLEICAEVANGREAVRIATELKPDIVIMDISMPELNGVDATRLIRRKLPSTEVLILTVHESEEMGRELVAAGARGFILKADDSGQLLTAIDQLCQHRPFFTARVTRMVLDEFVSHQADRDDRDGAEGRNEPATNLTGRERQVVQLLAEGKSNKEVAGVLSLAIKTVETHRFNVFRKLGIHSLSELVHYAIRNGLVEP